VIRALCVLAATSWGGTQGCRRERIAAVDALVARPSGGGEGPAVVYANAATPLGIEQPAVGRLVSALAGAGFVSVAPELPNVREGEVTPATVDALVDVARAARPRVALVGASTGAGLAILAAGDPRLASRVCAVAAIAPFASLENVLRLATTGTYADRAYPAAPLLARAAARSLAAAAPEDPAVPELLPNRDLRGSTRSTPRSSPRPGRSSTSSRRSRGLAMSSLPSNLRPRRPTRSSRSRSRSR
jgi:hypothetical protein